MCIRDSVEVFNGTSYEPLEMDRVYKVASNNFMRLGGDGYSVFLTNAINPVSYTHLRAHETVLDLVCPLLLETKQHTYRHHTNYMIINSEIQLANR